jgi:hypothetical protein
MNEVQQILDEFKKIDEIEYIFLAGSNKESLIIRPGNDLDIFLYTKKVTPEIISKLENIANKHPNYYFEFRSGPLKHKSKPQLHVLLNDFDRLNQNVTRYLIGHRGIKIKGGKYQTMSNISPEDYMATLFTPESVSKLIKNKKIKYQIWKETKNGFNKVSIIRKATDHELEVLRGFLRNITKLLKKLKN